MQCAVISVGAFGDVFSDFKRSYHIYTKDRAKWGDERVVCLILTSQSRSFPSNDDVYVFDRSRRSQVALSHIYDQNKSLFNNSQRRVPRSIISP